MDATSNLDLPFIMAAQAQKHVTHNEALRALDAIAQLMVLDKELAAPPGSPAEGARYIVASSPTGAWAGQAGKVAAYQDGAWAFYAPREGWLAWVADEDQLYVWSGSAWDAFAGGGGGGLGNVVEDTSPQLGGDLDANGHNVGFDNGTGITDDAGNEQVVFHKTASAVNQVGITNAATGNAPQIAAEGGDTHIDLRLAGKGTGIVRANGRGVSVILAQSAVAASHTGNTSETTLATVTVPANAMGANGALRITTLWSMTNNANNKSMLVRFGGTGGTAYYNLAASSVPAARVQVQLGNRNATNSQVGGLVTSSTGFGQSSATLATSSVDTTAPVDIVMRGQLTNSGDTITLEAYTVELLVA